MLLNILWHCKVLFSYNVLGFSNVKNIYKKQSNGNPISNTIITHNQVLFSSRSKGLLDDTCMCILSIKCWMFHGDKFCIKVSDLIMKYDFDLVSM